MGRGSLLDLASSPLARYPIIDAYLRATGSHARMTAMAFVVLVVVLVVVFMSAISVATTASRQLWSSPATAACLFRRIGQKHVVYKPLAPPSTLSYFSSSYRLRFCLQNWCGLNIFHSPPHV
jgi:hypothetical protein